MPRNKKMEDIRYLNVDLLIKSRSDLTPIVKAFGEDVIVMSNDKFGEFHGILQRIRDRPLLA